uniref:uncharacterized protein LOC122597604 n=1 Tax=Erigeron canadensis TaxID=72917 RepID=UPI001CB9437C|nr:uncharacterized protein LOC122597604 [Erigeron canadensis]
MMIVTKSRPSSPSRVSFVKKKIETKSSLAHPSVSVTVVESVESSSIVQCDCENDSSFNRVVPPAVDKKQIQDTAGPPMRNLSSNIPQSVTVVELVESSSIVQCDCENDSSLNRVVPPAADTKQIEDTEGPPMHNLSSNILIDQSPERDDESQASEDSQSSSLETESEISADSTSTTDTAENDSSSSEPEYYEYIRWEGYDMEYELSGYKCMICDMELSISPSGNDDEHSEDNDSDDEYYDEYQDEPQLFPAVDILSCGHAFHTECSTSTELITDKQSTDPECVFCLSMA